MPSIEGQLTVQLSARSNAVTIHSSRPLHACRLFEGKTIDETLKLMPMLFNICGQAQSLAAIRAIESAQGTHASNAVEMQRERLKNLETLREHLWRLLLDGARVAAFSPKTTLLSQLNQHILIIKNSLDPQQALFTTTALHTPVHTAKSLTEQLTELQQQIQQTLFHCDLKQWLAFDLPQLDQWIEHAQTPASQLLHWLTKQSWQTLGKSDRPALIALPEQELRAKLDAEQAEKFIAEPSWQQQTWHTGPAARQQDHPLMQAVQQQYGQGLLLRLLARLIEIAQLTLSLQHEKQPLEAAAKDGLSQLEAARGRLCHRVELDQDRITRYRILAPTEWNFHPQGVAVQALSELKRDNRQQAELQAHLLIHAIDPCVGFELQWSEH